MIPRSPIPKSKPKTDSKTLDPAFAPPPIEIQVHDLDIATIVPGLGYNLTLEPDDYVRETEEQVLIQYANGVTMRIFRPHIVAIVERTRIEKRPALPFEPPQ